MNFQIFTINIEIASQKNKSYLSQTDQAAYIWWLAQLTWNCQRCWWWPWKRCSSPRSPPSGGAQVMVDLLHLLDKDKTISQIVRLSTLKLGKPSKKKKSGLVLEIFRKGSDPPPYTWKLWNSWGIIQFVTKSERKNKLPQNTQNGYI